MIQRPPEPHPEPPDPDPVGDAQDRDYDPSAAFLAGDYATYCPQCGTRTGSYLAQDHTCERCGLVWTRERERP